MQQEKSQTDRLKLKILDMAPPKPQKGKKIFIFVIILILLLWWSFVGAKLRVVDLIKGVPQIGDVVMRMMPPDFSAITDPDSYGIKSKYKARKDEVPSDISNKRPKDYTVTFQLDNGFILKIDRNYVWKKGSYQPVLKMDSKEIINTNDISNLIKDQKTITRAVIENALKTQNINFSSVAIKESMPDTIELPLLPDAVPDKYTIPSSRLTANQRKAIPTPYLADIILADQSKITARIIPRLDDKLEYKYSFETATVNLADLKLALKTNIESPHLDDIAVSSLKKQQIKTFRGNLSEDSSMIELPVSLMQIILPFPNYGDLPDIRNKFWSSLQEERWWNNIFPNTIIGATLQTIQMALAGTFIALILAFPLAFLAARNTTPHKSVYFAVRGALNLIRTIPDLALGLIFVSAVGLGPFSGTMALAIHTTSVLAKLLSESIENTDHGIVEAIRATGAGYSQILSFAILPQILPDLISFTLYRFETNIRSAAVLGLIGAGGIGYLMTNAFRTFQYPEAAGIILILIVLVITVDTMSAKLRKMVI